MLELEPLYAAEAKRRMSEGGGSGDSGRQKSDNPTRTDEQLAKLAGTSRDTIRKATTAIHPDEDSMHANRCERSRSGLGRPKWWP